MPIIDMTRKELEEYFGVSNKPNDFESFWEKRIQIADSIKLEYSLNKIEFLNKDANYYELTFKSIDGELIYAKYICPNNSKKSPIVLEFHDYKEASKGWHNLTRYIGIGYSILAMDCRGQGGKTNDSYKSKGPTVLGHLIQGIDDSIENLYYCKVYLDGYVLSRIAKDLSNTDNEKLITFGKGQGAAIGAFVARFNKNVKKCSMQYPYLSDFRRVYEMGYDENYYEGIRYYFRWFDPLHNNENKFFEKLEYINIVNLAENLTCELLLGTGLLDTLCLPSTQYAFYNNAKCKKKHLVFEKYGHELNNFFENENLKFMEFKNID